MTDNPVEPVESVKMKRCRVCGELQPVAVFGFTKRKRRGRICQECAARRKADTQLPKWDWARAMSKFAIMRSRKQENKRGPIKRDKTTGFKEYSSILTHETLRALLDCQGGRCAITGQAMHLPRDTELKPRQTLTSWSKRLPKDQADRVPVLVRLDPTFPWEPGNVALIVRAWREIYEACSSYSAFNQMILNMRDFKTLAPTHDLLIHTMWQRTKLRMDKMK